MQRNPKVRVWTRAKRKLVVDSFAGGGGASTGIAQALGRDADIAINHDAEAIHMHQVNHPTTRHYIEDVWRVDPVKATRGRGVSLLWLSPDCKHFSKAKGQKPLAKKVRGLAWVGVHWAQKVRPDVIVLENVEEFETWGPLDAESRPDPKRKGIYFKRFVAKLRKLGYEVEWQQLLAADYGAPTKRNRLFLVARCDGQPITWPAETHAAEGGGLAPWRAAAEIIDWTVAAPSIFERKRPLADNTLWRIANGIQRYVVDAKEPFIVRTGHYFKNRATTFRGQSLRDPLGVVCATNDKNLVLPYLRRPGASGGGSTQPLVAAWMAKHYGGVVGHDLYRPIGTVTSKDHHSLVTAFLVKYYGGGGSPAGQVQSLLEPLHTVTSKARFGLVEIEGTPYEIVDIGMRMLTPRELYNAQGFPDDYEIDMEVGGKPLTQKAQIRMAGNSVCPDVARAVVEANAPASAA